MLDWLRAFAVAIAACLLLADAAAALTVSFGCFRDPADTAACDVGAAQFSAELEARADGIQVTFSNQGDRAAFISEIYVDDSDGRLGAYTLNVGNVGDVLYRDGARPKNLPGGNEIGFAADFGFEPTSPGTGKRGVDLGESLGVLFDGDFDAVAAALHGGSLRIALRGQGLFPDGDSESFLVSSPPIPEPGAGLVFGLGLAGVARATRRRRARG